jgi:hypothetical protein
MTFVAMHIKREAHFSVQVQTSFCSLRLPCLSLPPSKSSIILVFFHINLHLVSERCLKCILMLFCFVPITIYAESIPPHLNANLNGQICALLLS